MVPGHVAGHRLGWFPESALVFAEGHPAAGDLGCADDLPDVLERLELEIGLDGCLAIALVASCRRATRCSVPLPWSSKPGAAYCWCDWCGDEWEALGIRDRYGTEIWETSDHNRRCERGSRYVGVAWTPRERARRSGELFPGDL
jgi:hypothetical protein